MPGKLFVAPKHFVLTALILLLSGSTVLPNINDTGMWGDQGNGMYYNRIIPGDYSDEDVILVDSTYYMISSTMQLAPGMIVLSSRDLVNWQISGHVVGDISKISAAYNYTGMNSYGHGIWAGAIRYHNNRFRVYFATDGQGFYMSSAANAAGPWDTLTSVITDTGTGFPGAGWDDCCPYWEYDSATGDTTGYFLCSNTTAPYTIHLFQMTADGKHLVSTTNTVIYSGPGAEANKLFKLNGYYYFFHSENSGGTGRNMFMLRSTNIWGTGGSPGHAGTYQMKQIFSNNSSGSDRQPNQGGIVPTPSGSSWWFVTQQGILGADGRPCCLLPVTWINNWPIIGTVSMTDTLGAMVWSDAKPISGYPIVLPQSSDDFNDTVLSPQWEWNYQPRAGYWSLSVRPGFLRLNAFTPLTADNLFKAGNTLTERFMRGDSGVAMVKMDIANMADGQEAGMCHMNGGSTYSTIGVLQSSTGVRNLRFKNSSTGSIVLGAAIPTGDTTVWLKSQMKDTINTEFQYSLDSVTFTALGSSYTMAGAGYRGDRLGVYTFNNTSTAGYVDIDWFHYTYSGPTPTPTSVIDSRKAPGTTAIVSSVHRITLKNKVLSFDFATRFFRRYEIHNLLGRTLFAANLPETSNRVVMPIPMSRGVYIMRIIGPGQAFDVPVLSQ
jgi:beta-xylosidase